MNRIAIIAAYNEAGNIGPAIQSVKGWANRIVVADGAWKGYPLENGDYRSTDGTVQEALQAGAEVIEPEGPWEDQVAKRNALLVGSEPEDWYLILDADERLVGLPYYTVWRRAFSIRIVGNRYNSRSFSAGTRLVRNAPGLCYEQVHDRLVSQGGPVEPEAILKDCYIQHLAHLRSDERNAAKDIYAAGQWEEEMPRRKALGIA